MPLFVLCRNFFISLAPRALSLKQAVQVYSQQNGFVIVMAMFDLFQSRPLWKTNGKMCKPVKQGRNVAQFGHLNRGPLAVGVPRPSTDVDISAGQKVSRGWDKALSQISLHQRTMDPLC